MRYWEEEEEMGTSRSRGSEACVGAGNVATRYAAF